jgi:hypothetical protein
MSKLLGLTVVVVVLTGCAPLGPEQWLPKDDPARLRRDSHECQREAQASGTVGHSPL